MGLARIRGTGAFRRNALAFPSSLTPILGGLHILSFAFSRIRGLPAADAGLELVTSVGSVMTCLVLIGTV